MTRLSTGGVILAAVTVCAPTGAAAERSADALEVLRRANAALERAGVLEFDVEYLGTDVARSHVTGRVVLDRSDPARIRYRARLRIGLGSGYSGHADDFEIGADGDDVWRVDHRRRLVEVGPRGEAGFLANRTLGFAAIPQMLRDPAFAVEIETAERAELVGTTVLDGVECDVVFLSFSDQSGLGEQFFHIGREDGLPRRVVMAVAGADPGRVFHFDHRLRGLRSAASGPRRPDPPAGYAVERIGDVGPGDPAPGFALTDTAGRTVHLEDLRGQVVVLDFWATWCPFCTGTHSALDELRRELAAEPVKLLAVNIWESGDPQAYVSENGYGFRVLVDGDAVADLYRVASTPTAIVIGADGRIRHRETSAGAERIDALRRVVREILAEGAPSSAAPGPSPDQIRMKIRFR